MKSRIPIRYWCLFFVVVLSLSPQNARRIWSVGIDGSVAHPSDGQTLVYSSATSRWILGTGGSGSGGTDATAVTTNCVPKSSDPTHLVNSHVCEDGTTGQITTTRSLNGPANTVTFSATPVFDASLGDPTITLTGDVTSSTYTNPKTNLIQLWRICQDGTGSHSFVYPTNVTSAPSILTGASQCTNFFTRYDGANAVRIGVPWTDGGSSTPGISIPGSSSGSMTIQAPATGGGTVTGPTGSGTLFGTQTLSNVVQAGMFAADAGANDTYVVTYSPAITSYVTGVHYYFKANTANTGAATLNVNGLGAKTVVKVAGGITTTLADNDIRAGQWVDTVYDGTNLQMTSALGNSASATISGTQGQMVAVDTSSGTAGAVWVNLCGGQTFVYCPNSTLKKIWASNATSATNTDLNYNGSAYTPAAGRRFIAYQGIAATGNTGGTCNWYWRHSSVDYRVTASVTPNAIPSQIAISPPIVLEAGDGFRFSCTSTGGAINAWLMGVEYDAVAGSPFTSAIFNTFSAGGNVTLYTVTAGKNYMPIIAAHNSAVTLGCFNNSGGSRTLTSYLVPSGGSAGATNKMLSGTSLSDVSKGNYQTMAMATAGDFFVLSSDAVTSTQICWQTGYEQ